ncbi:hypothetical protein HMPREF3220_01408 [Citrobacter koseri]|nr:hypothetical protein HMPREF3220_01408 [Citrobacter koseri]
MAGKKSQYACLLPILAMMSIYSRAYAVAFNTDFLAGDSKCRYVAFLSCLCASSW